MQTTKPFWQSKTFWGALATAGLGLFGTSEADLPFTSDGLSDAIVTVLTAVSAAYTVWARGRATKMIRPLL